MKILDFPEFKQITKYDCGACALESVFAYYGKDILEEKIMKVAGTIPKTGTSVKGMMRAVKFFGFSGKLEILNIEKLKKCIDKNKPVILRIQAWSDNKNNLWCKDKKHGHYVVVIGYDTEKFYFEDPWCHFRTCLRFDELFERWHDVDVDGKEYINCGIIILRKRKKYNSKDIIHMD